MEQKQKFSGPRMLVSSGLIYAFVGALGLTVAQLTNSYMVLDPEVTMNRTYLGLGFSAFILVQGISAPLIGWTIAKKGARFSYILGAVIVAVLAVLNAMFLGDNVLFYIVGFGIIMSYGCMCAGAIPTMTTLNHWYIKNRGRAISISLIMAAGIAVFYPIITNALCMQFGWRAGWWFVACCALIGLILAAVFVRNTPADMGQLPDGGKVEVSSESKTYVSKVYKTMEDKTAIEAMKTPAFWFIAIMAFCCFAGLNLNVSQAGLYFVSVGLTLEDVSWALSIKAVGGIVALVGGTILLDRLEPVRWHGFGALFMGVGALLAAFFGSSMFVMVFYYVTIGLGFAMHNSALPAELANIFGNKHYSKIHGAILPAVAVLASFVPTIAGAVYDATGTYFPAFIALAIIGLIGFAVSLMIRLPKPGEELVESAASAEPVEFAESAD